MELKLIADIGIVGVPNAGKSSLIKAITNAMPKIADYPFTTVEPNLGVAQLDTEITLILADIPGLIEGAHKGVGLGDAFLKHIQRTRVLIHLIDGLSKEPIADLTQTNNELALFDPELFQKPQVIALTKIDLPDVQAKWEKLRNAFSDRGYEALAISSVTHQNLDELLWKAHQLLIDMPLPILEAKLPLYKPEEDYKVFKVGKVKGGWRVIGKAIERSAAMTYWEYEGSVRRFQRMLEVLGIDEALREQGITNGDIVFIGDYELEWQD